MFFKLKIKKIQNTKNHVVTGNTFQGFFVLSLWEIIDAELCESSLRNVTNCILMFICLAKHVTCVFYKDFNPEMMALYNLHVPVVGLTT